MMNRFGATQFDGPVTLTLAATLPQQPVRLGEFQAFLSGAAPRSHTHLLNQLTDWANLGPYVGAVVEASESVAWSLAAGRLAAAVILQPGGGLVQTPAGLAVELTGLGGAHTHLLADITDFDAQLPAKVQVLLSGTNTIDWSTDGNSIAAVVRRKTNGGLLEDSNGLFVDIGTGATQVAAGNHTHTQLHPPVTLLSGSGTLNLTLTGQQLGGEVQLHPTGGLVVLLSGVGADFGTGHNQAARGDHTHAQLHNPVTTVSSSGLALSVNGNQLVSGAVRVDPAPAANRGKVGIGAAGLYVALGNTTDTAAAGNHGHTPATPSTDGFLSAVDKARLDALAAASSFLSGVYQSVCVTLEASALVGEYLLGRYQWENRMRLVAAQVVGRAGALNTVLEMEVAGVLTGQQLTLPSGANFPEREGAATYSSFYITAGDKLRVKVVSGSGIDLAAYRLEVNLQMRPA